MRKLNLRQGAAGGLVVATICAASAAGRSAEPLVTFAVFFGVAMVPVAAVTAAAVVLNRNAAGPRAR